jgi:hypothetical protein
MVVTTLKALNRCSAIYDELALIRLVLCAKLHFKCFALGESCFIAFPGTACLSSGPTGKNQVGTTEARDHGD